MIEKKAFSVANLLKRLLVVPAVLVGLIGICILVSLYYDMRFSSDEMFFIVGKLSLFPIVFAVSLIMYFFFKWLEPKSKLEHKIALLGVAVGLIFGTLSLFTFDKFTENGISSYSILGETHYEFSDVAIYKVEDGFDGVLKVQFEMNDGKEFTFMGGVLDAVGYDSKNIEDFYEDPYKDYVLEVTQILKNQNVPIEILSMEQFAKTLDYDYWIDLAKTITEIYEQ